MKRLFESWKHMNERTYTRCATCTVTRSKTEVLVSRVPEDNQRETVFHERVSNGIALTARKSEKTANEGRFLGRASETIIKLL